MYRALLITVCACGLVTMVNCAFACGSRSLCNMIFYYTCIFALCTEFTVFRFASHIFSVVPCMYILTSRMQRTPPGRYVLYLLSF